MASVVAFLFGTIDELLFGIAFKFTSFEEHGSFEGAYSRESPTRTASFLVFDVVNGAFSSPINFSGQVGSVKSYIVFRSGRFIFGGVKSSKFLICQVRELVKTKGVGGLWSSGPFLKILDVAIEGL